VRAIVLVGGFGTRLRPLTLTVPKQMLPVCGMTMLERVVARLGAFGVDEVVLSLGYRPDVFTAAYPDGVCAGVRLRYAVEPEPLDTAGAIAFAAREAGIDETFLALNGDVLTDMSLDDLVAHHRSSGATATLSLTPVEDPSRYGVVPTAEDGRVLDFVEKPDRLHAPSRWINGGTYVVEPGVLDLVEPGQKVSIERVVFPALAARAELHAVQSDAYWIDAGTPEAYLQAHLDLLDGTRDDPCDAVDASAKVAGDAVVSRSALGADVVVDAGAHVVDSVLMDGAVVGPGARLERAIVGGGSVVGAGSALSELAVVGFGVHLPDGTVQVGGTAPPPEEWA
jgi:mannose-1-phosphate guanylyltransferase